MNRKKSSFASIILIFFFLFSGCSLKTHSQPENGTSTPSKHYNVKNDGGNFSQNDIIYFILTDRFLDGEKSNNSKVDKNNSSAYHGGDLKGITEKLDYIKSIGSTAIWITPVVQNEDGGYHGYWANDFYNVDPHLGKMDDLKNLVTEAHKRDIKVILDYVVNHTGPNTPWLNDGKHENWFHEKKDIVNYEDRNECENGWLSGLPDLNQENNDVSDYLIKNALWWIDNTNVDGFRLDTVKHVPKEFWNRFSYYIKDKYPDFYLIGEVWSGDSAFLEQYHKQGIDGLVNYPLFFGIRDAFKPFGNTSSLVNAIQSQSNFSSPHLNGIFIDNHDNKRFITNVGENGDKYLRLALTFEMTYPGVPIIYYGTEIAMEGANDPDNRRDMDWEKTKNSEMLTFYKNLIQLRNTYPALKSEAIELLNHDSRFISYKRGNGNDSLIIVMNIEDNLNKIIIGNKETFSEYKDLLSGKTYKVSDDSLNLEIQPISLMILQPIK